MQTMKQFVLPVFLACVLLTLPGCAGVGERQSEGAAGDCKSIIEWVDFLKLNDITYSYNSEGTEEIKAGQQEKQIGEVAYMLNGHACTDHVSQNGDAAYLPAGTPVYAMKGYKSSYRVVAANKVYEAQRNPHAKTIGELWDIDGKIAKVSLESGMDGSPIGDFTPDASAVFAEELPGLENVGFDAIYKDNKPEYGIFLRVHLIDGTSFRMVFYEKANAFTAGAYGTEALRDVIVSERTRIKQAAGM